jgi:futalosine hydrolase
VSDVLVVVATALEAARLPKLPGARVVVSGVGAVSGALAAQAASLGERPRLVMSVGIGGAYPRAGLAVREVAVASASVYATLGAEDGDDFLGLRALSLPLLEREGERYYDALPVAPGARSFASASGAAYGPILTVETVTGSRETAARLEARHPGALVEAMEGAGVAQAALGLGLPFLEVRAVSNPVGPRDRASWDIPGALGALAGALEGGWPTLG